MKTQLDVLASALTAIKARLCDHLDDPELQRFGTLDDPKSDCVSIASAALIASHALPSAKQAGPCEARNDAAAKQLIAMGFTWRHDRWVRPRKAATIR